MRRYDRRLVSLSLALSIAVATTLVAQQRGAGLSQEQTDRRWRTEKELQSVAVVERKVLVPMRDGVRLATDVYRPKNATGGVPTVWVRTPYIFNHWDVRNGVPADMTNALTAVKRGYAFVVQNERGHFFSEGNYDILGAPTTDGDDMLSWISSQAWSNGKEASLLDTRSALAEARQAGTVTISAGAKGGRTREISLSSATQLEALSRAAGVQGKSRNLIPAEASWREWREGALRDGREAIQAHGIDGYHDLRAAYACERYETLTGHAAPVMGGHIEDRQADPDAREQISHELGHDRIEVVAEYIGGRGT